VGRDPLAGRELSGIGLDGLERGLDADLDATLGQLLRGVLAQARRDLRQDLRRHVDQHPALRRVSEGRVVAQGVAHQVRELGESLHARVTGADEDEGQLALALRVVTGGIGSI
jgi:hypothetical protein